MSQLDQILIPCFDAAGCRAGNISADSAASLVRAGRGLITRSRTGRQRFVALPAERTGHDNRAGSRTTQAMRAGGSLTRGPGQLLGSAHDGRPLQEHNLDVCYGYGGRPQRLT